MTENIRGAQIQEISTADLILSLAIRDNTTETFTNYSRPIIKVREDNGDTEEDIHAYFPTGFVDNNSVISDGVTTITEWLTASGATNAYIVTFYDQSSAGKNTTQATTSKQALLELNGIGVRARPYYQESIYVNNITDYDNSYSQFMVLNAETYGANNFFYANGSNSPSRDIIQCYIDINSNINITVYNSTGTASLPVSEVIEYDTNYLFTFITNGSGTVKIYLNGVEKFNDSIAGGFKGTVKFYGIGSNRVNSAFYSGKIDEVLIYKKVLSDGERQTVERKLINDYSIV